MTYRELFDAAVRMVDENAADGDTEDYEERAGYLLATACSQCAPQDEVYRKAHGLGQSTTQDVGLYVTLDGEFPLSPIFAPAVACYLAAMLVLDENEEMSDTLFSHYANALAAIRGGLPVTAEKIADHYEGTL
ncbi:MAG: hypothetical protein IJX62_05410 [Clostridia bacterium]|nr:hypothetical protein [Clostridia bacterium]